MSNHYKFEDKKTVAVYWEYSLPSVKMMSMFSPVTHFLFSVCACCLSLSHPSQHTHTLSLSDVKCSQKKHLTLSQQRIGDKETDKQREKVLLNSIMSHCITATIHANATIWTVISTQPQYGHSVISTWRWCNTDCTIKMQILQATHSGLFPGHVKPQPWLCAGLKASHIQLHGHTSNLRREKLFTELLSWLN